MKAFFDNYRKYLGKLRKSQVGPLEALAVMLLNDTRLTMKQKAYVMATVHHETAATYRPLDEYGKGKGRRYGKPDKQTGKIYYGRGYVQLTWKENYRKMGKLLNVDLVNHPEKAKDPKIAYEILIVGMKRGLFTGKALGDYISPQKTDYRRARQIVNGMDKASHIAKLAVKFEKVLKATPKGSQKAIGASQATLKASSVVDIAPDPKAPDGPQRPFRAVILDYIKNLFS